MLATSKEHASRCATWLAVEVVPRYRRAAEENLAGLDEPPPAP